MKQVIYETTGRAKEFNELACNLFDGCSHGCLYCYSPLVTHKTKEQFQHPQIRVTALDMLQSAKQWVAKGETRRPLLCFIGDPYDPIEQDVQITRKCIMALHEAGLNVIILTKGGVDSMRDFDLLTPKDAYATTLTCLNPNDSILWEPHASLPIERIRALATAHSMDIETWVSFEPVLYPEQVRELLEITRKYTGHYKIGKLNYTNKLPLEYQVIVRNINWHKFGWDMKALCDSLEVKSYFKTDLLKEMGVNPTEFKQTWICR